jgi:hypothetical protein
MVPNLITNRDHTLQRNLVLAVIWITPSYNGHGLCPMRKHGRLT